MDVNNVLKFMKFTPVLTLITGLLVLASVEIRSSSDSESNNEEMAPLLNCGYIRRNIANTIFHPDFILYLSGQQEKFNILSESHIKKAIGIWNNKVADKRERIHYQQAHFNKLALLSETADECDSDHCVVDGDDFAVLRYWMSGIVAELAENSSLQIITPAELKRLNVEDDRNIGKALDMIMSDPVGQRLIANAVRQKVIIRPASLHGHNGYFEYAEKNIVIDPTVASYIFKINCIVHELVHVSNYQHDNSVFEESLAEIIGMAVQDRITGIEISCSPYVVFVDRLLDPHYGKYPLRNDIKRYLKQAGIVINNSNDEGH